MLREGKQSQVEEDQKVLGEADIERWLPRLGHWEARRVKASPGHRLPAEVTELAWGFPSPLLLTSGHNVIQPGTMRDRGVCGWTFSWTALVYGPRNKSGVKQNDYFAQGKEPSP